MVNGKFILTHPLQSWGADNSMITAKEFKELTKGQKKMIETHKKRMFLLRVNNEDWQLIHQRRWEDNSPCWEDKCDC